MDLRPWNLTPEWQLKASEVLNYQPFIISDEAQTGVAYSVLYSSDPRIGAKLVFRKSECSPEEWDRATFANAGLRHMYDSFVQQVAMLFPGKSLLDLACNNGYFPIAAERLGMRGCAGMDQGAHFADSISLLNSIFGTQVEFFFRTYIPEDGGAEPLPRRFDVVCMSAILCHLPDPLRFLKYACSQANEAILFWGQVLETEHFLISYNQPHTALSDPRHFPWTFNDNTRISLGLFKHAMSELGFPSLHRLSGTEWMASIEADRPSLDDEVRIGSRHLGLLFTR